PDRVVVATGAERPAPRIPGGDLPLVQTGDTLRNLMLGTASADEAGFFLRVVGRLGRLSGITRRPAWIRRLTKIALPMGKDVVVIGGSLVGLELAEFLAERGRRVTLLHEEQQLGLPLAMPRRWTAVRHARDHGVDIRRNVEVTRITESGAEWTGTKGENASAPADMVIYAEGTTASAPLADELRAAGVDVEVIGAAGDVGYIHGAIHSAWHMATTGSTDSPWHRRRWRTPISPSPRPRHPEPTLLPTPPPATLPPCSSARRPPMSEPTAAPAMPASPSSEVIAPVQVSPWTSFSTLLRWSLASIGAMLPLIVVIQAMLAAGIVIGFGFLIPDITPDTALFLA